MNGNAKVPYFVVRYGEVPAKDEDPGKGVEANEEQFDKQMEENLFYLNLSSCLKLNGKNYDTQSIKMQSFLYYGDLWQFVENGHEETQVGETKSSALYLIQQAMDERLTSIVIVPTTSQEYWKILEIEFSLKQSDINELAQSQFDEGDEEKPKIEDHFIEEKVNIVVSESHYAKTHGDDENDIEDENIAIKVEDTHANHAEHTFDEGEFEGDKDPTIQVEDVPIIQTEHTLKFDEEDPLGKEWLQIMKEKVLIDYLLNERILRATLNQVKVIAE